MTTIEIASYIAAALLALSRLLKAAEPLWNKLPQKVALFIPAIFAMIPVAVSKLGSVQTHLDLVEALIVAGALLLPGAGVTLAGKGTEKKDSA